MLTCSQEIFFHNDMQQTKKSRQYNRKDQYNGLINNPNVIISANNFRDKEEQVWPPDVEDAFTEGKNKEHEAILFFSFALKILNIS
jgi:hypothetical protein